MPHACNFIKKKTLEQVFSSKFCEIFKNNVFIEHLRWLLLTIKVTFELAGLACRKKKKKGTARERATDKTMALLGVLIFRTMMNMQIQI